MPIHALKDQATGSKRLEATISALAEIVAHFTFWKP